jgi:hypothetical protein
MDNSRFVYVTYIRTTPEKLWNALLGWPAILASLKSLLETGAPLEETRRWPKGI